MSPGRHRCRSLALVAAVFGASVVGSPALADPQAGSSSTPEIRPAPAVGFLGRAITRIEVVTVGARWARPVTLRRVRVGDTMSAEVARRALQELLDSGGYADGRAEASDDANGVVLKLLVTPRRIVAAAKISGGALEAEESLRAAGVETGAEITAATLADGVERLRALYVRRGYPAATVAADAVDTDDPMQVTVELHVALGKASTIARRSFRVVPVASRETADLLDGYAISAGDRADEDSLASADRALQVALRRAGFEGAEVAHRLETASGRTLLTVEARTGPRVSLRFEGNHRFDEAELSDALDLEESDDRAAATLASKIQKFYVERGFLDAEVTTELRGRPTDTENLLVLHVREGEVVRVIAREFPCLGGERSADDVGGEIDSFLSEALPGTGLFGAVDPARVDAALGPRGPSGARVAPTSSNPWRTFVAEVYERATRHLQELYRSEGYLSATVGPVVPMRRACDRHSPAGACIPVGERVRPAVSCPVGAELPAVETAPPPSCTPDLRRGIRCEPELVLHIPIKLGPRAVLWDVSFEGNELFAEAELARLAELSLGAPVSQIELEKSRRRLLDEYAERGFAFASIEQHIELSPDHTRARARFIINERGQVRVKDIVVRGAERTNEALILARVALAKGDLYRRSAVRTSEERISTLGVFSSVTVGLEDPEVFAREKVVVVTVRERASQYLDVRPGFSTGDGFRVTFEYGHRNLADHAIHLTLRSQLGLLPDFLILDPVVRPRYDALPLRQRLERRNSISVEFPEIGLGPLFPLGIDVIDVRDNSRDFGLTKEAAILTQNYRPSTHFVAQIGGSLERNDATIFAGDTLEDYIIAHPETGPRLRVPDGLTTVVAERANVTWDRRDNPFNATKGTYFYGSAEHVHDAPADETAKTPVSDFMRMTSRVAGYVPFGTSGLALALSFRWGQNVQLVPGSQTYPDRLFFLGGVDSLRGFLQDSVIPEDVAEKILADQKRAHTPGVDPASLLTPEKVAIRGGDLFLNPRAELRIPLAGAFQTTVFLDAGNLWLDPRAVEPWKLRYGLGTGLRAGTPIGPLALDIGFNLDRRYWEDPFAFHFSIGLF